MTCLLLVPLFFALFLFSAQPHVASAATAEEYHRAASVALQAKNYEKALDLLSEAIKIDPKDASLLNTVGVIFNAAGDVDHAAEYFASSLKLNPKAFSTNYNAANLMHFGVFEKDGSRVDALEASTAYYLKAFESMLSAKETADDSISKSEEFRFLTDAGTAMMKAAKYVEAIQFFTKLLEIDPNNPYVMSDLSLAYLGSGDVDTAIRFSSIAIERSPSEVKLQRNHDLILRNSSSAPAARDKILEGGTQIEDYIVFGMSFDHHHEATNVTNNIRIELKRSDDPIMVINELQSKLELDLLTLRWLYSNLRHAVARLNEHVVLESPVNVDGQKLPKIRVHFGDDLFALSRSYSYLHGLSNGAADAIYSSLTNRVSQHTEVAWINARKMQQYKQADTKIEGDYMSAIRNRSGSTKQCKITLAIVTTGALQSFYNLITKLPSSSHLCEVMVFDYMFPVENKLKIINDFPHFDFVFIAKKDNGHAVTLNTILRIVKTPYVFYMNDSWEPIGDCSERIDRAFLLMEATKTVGMPVAQVLMNEQSSTTCAFGLNPSDCHDNKYFGKAGWLRRLTVDSVSIDFFEHEFGVQYKEHLASSSWPGFSSHHPALWNLNLLTSSKNVFFDENRNDYDLVFALKVLESGMTTVHLPDMGFHFKK